MFSLFKKNALVGTDINKIRSTFEQISQNTSWDIQGKLLYGYFFFDKSKDQLESFSKILKDEGLNIVDLSQSDDERYRLHVEEIAIHTPESLVERNKQFHMLADKYKISSYDGYDIGPVQR